MVKKISEKKIYGGIEGGGTKFRCVIGLDPDNIYASSEIDTKTPILTIKELINHNIPMITLEEHNIIGGLGTAVAEVIAESGKSVKFRRI